MARDATRRKELRTEYRQTPKEAGVYRILNTQTGKSLLGTTANVQSMHNKMSFARSTNSASTFDLRLRPDITQYGLEAFSLEILESFTPAEDMTPAEIQRDLDTLEELWREKFDPALLY